MGFEQKITLYKIVVVSLFFIIIYNLYILMIDENNKYKTIIDNINNQIIYGKTAPRGRIYDRNMNVLVDNESKPIIIYKRPKNLSQEQEIMMAKKIINYLDLNYYKVTEQQLKEFYYLNNDLEYLITSEEQEKLKKREISSTDIYNLKISRITKDKLDNMSEEDKKASYVYYLMNNGYLYDEKIIKENDVTDQEYSYFLENIEDLNGFSAMLSYKRVYPYKETFRSVLGNVGKIPYEEKDYYLKKGYSINDEVGISYLEKQYDDILKGEKAEYKKINKDTLKMIKESKKGKDIVLEIDIKLQQAVDDIIKEEILIAKKEPNTEYFNKTYAIIQDSKTGGILSFNGLQYIKNSKTFSDISINNILSSYTPGSIVKGASMIVGYNNNAVKIGEKMTDECIKIKSSPPKCSSYQVGIMDDVGALTHSSNIYQFKIAIRIGQGKYSYNQPLALNLDAFDIYRNTFKEFGLGVKTEIDLENESLGLTSEKRDTNLLLNYAIGQYDSYTPIQLAQYMNTFANDGKRLAPHFLKEYDGFKYEPKILNTINTEPKYLDRIEQGFKEVIRIGTGYKMLGNIKNGAGKTGTSQSYIDTNNDGIIDRESITSTFSGYAPYDNPKITITVVSPDVAVYKDNNFMSFVNRRISKKIANYYNDNYTL